MDRIISVNDAVLQIINFVSLQELKHMDAASFQQFMESSGSSDQFAGQLYKRSEYIYHLGNKEQHLLYNTLYNALVRLSDEEYNEFIAEHTDNTTLRSGLIENGFWVPKDLDEREKYLQVAELLTRHLKRPANYTITTTLRCNARCCYCYEAGVSQHDFSPEKAERLIEFIKSRDCSYGVHLNWFGGEPLMNSSLIDYVSEKLYEEGIPYSAYIITNGSLLDDEMIESKLEKWHLHDMQITIDGTREEYKKRKNYLNEDDGDYDRLFYRISQAAKKGVYIHIRLNIDRENIQDIYSLIKNLEQAFGEYNNIVFYPAFITGCEKKLSDEECVEIVYQLLKQMKDIRKLTTGRKLYAYPKIHACMKEDPNSFSVDVSGEIYNCEHLVGRPAHRIGTIEQGLFAPDSRTTRSLLRNECFSCVFLPKCMGGCAASYQEHDSACMIDKYLIMAYLRLLLM